MDNLLSNFEDAPSSSSPDISRDRPITLTKGTIFISKTGEAYAVLEVYGPGSYKVLDIITQQVKPFEVEKDKNTVDIFHAHYTAFQPKNFVSLLENLTRRARTANILLDPENCDVLMQTLGNNPKKIYTHKFLLVKQCELFRRYFAQERPKSPTGLYTYDVLESEFSQLQAMMNYLHGQTSILPAETYREAVSAAAHYGCPKYAAHLLRELPGKLSIAYLPNYFDLLQTNAVSRAVFEFMRQNWVEIKEKHFDIYQKMTPEQSANFVNFLMGATLSVSTSTQTTQTAIQTQTTTQAATPTQTAITPTQTTATSTPTKTPQPTITKTPQPTITQPAQPMPINVDDTMDTSTPLRSAPLPAKVRRHWPDAPSENVPEQPPKKQKKASAHD